MNRQQEAVNKLEKTINHAVELIDIGIWEYNIQKDQGFWTDKMYEIFGLNKKVIPTFRRVEELIHPEDHEGFTKRFRYALNKKQPYNDKFRIIRKNGSERMLRHYAEVLLNKNNEITWLIGITVDITEQVAIQNKLSKSDIQIKEISDILDVGIWAADIQNNKMVFCSKGVEAITGYSVYEFEHNLVYWGDLVYSEDLSSYQCRQEQLQLGNTPKCTYRIVRKNGEVKWVQDQTIPTFDFNGNIVRLDGIITDITEQKETEEKITYMANHDYLTDLPNRRLFDKELNHLIEERKQRETETTFALLHLDLDDFKKINDAFGHLVGDRILVEVAARLRLCIGKDDLAVRIGGDEFSILVKNVQNKEKPTIIAKKIVDALTESFCIDEYELYVTTSIGIVIYPNEKDDSETFVKKSDIALYRAKELGKNHFIFYSPSMEKEFLRLFTLEQELRKAIKDEKLTLHYQPKIDAFSSYVVGAEALIRWHHDELGMISPGEFIPLAEESGLIFDITDWTFRTVCEQLKKWEQMDVPVVPVSVNISPKRFLKYDWVETFIGIIEETNVNPKMIELEITESALIDNEESFLSSIKALKELGIKVSLDDFGTGYSSPIYLKKFFIDTIKIDQYFIQEFLGQDAPIVKYIIDLAHELKMKVVAEGVETEEQLTFLQRNGCDQIQGFLFSKPVPEGDFRKIISGWNSN